MVVLLMGPPGCGKGTQSRLICENFSFQHISTGDLIREEIASGTDRAQNLKALIARGELVSDQVIFSLIESKLADPRQNYLCDGIPRTLDQAKRLKGVLAKVNMRIDRAIQFDVPDSDIVKRLSGRKTCVDCKSIFNVHFNPPSKPEVCDDCGGELLQRIDDTAKAVEARLSGYHELSQPILDFLSELGVLSVVNGAQSSEAVYADVEKILKNEH